MNLLLSVTHTTTLSHYVIFPTLGIFIFSMSFLFMAKENLIITLISQEPIHQVQKRKVHNTRRKIIIKKSQQNSKQIIIVKKVSK